MKLGTLRNDKTIYIECLELASEILYFSDKILQLNEPGDPLWMTREEYIIFGAQRLASCDSTIREG